MIATSRIFFSFLEEEEKNHGANVEANHPLLSTRMRSKKERKKKEKQKKKKKERKRKEKRRRRRKNLHFSPARPLLFSFFSFFFLFSFFFFLFSFFLLSPHRCQHALRARGLKGNSSLLERRDHTNPQMVLRQNIFKGMAWEGALSPQHPTGTY